MFMAIFGMASHLKQTKDRRSVDSYICLVLIFKKKLYLIILNHHCLNKKQTRDGYRGDIRGSCD
jgi:hypothetical protein